MQYTDNFAVFILSHGRADRIKTIKALEDGNYTGKIYIVIDNEDETAGEYYARYGDQVLMFDKLAVSKTFDTADNFSERRTIVYARNVCFDLARKLGIEYFLELDDDYTTFHFRRVADNKFTQIQCLQLDRLFDAMIDFLEDTQAITVAFAQGGDFIGGKDNGNFKKGILRKAMNTFFCTTKRPFQFLGRVNEDVNTYTWRGSVGELIFTITGASINQTPTQSNKGGMTEQYLDSGTYLKSFYTVMFMPSAVKIAQMGSSYKRIHHHVFWNNCVPKILDRKYKKI